MKRESDLKRVHAMNQLETAIAALRGGMDAKAQYEVQGAMLNITSLVEERKREAARRNMA